MPLVSMEQPKKKESTDKPVEVSSYYEKYPYGLRITLNKEALKKLGLSSKDFSSGQTGTLEASYTVISTSDRTSIEGGDNMSVELQITGLALSQNKKKSAQVAKPR